MTAKEQLSAFQSSIEKAINHAVDEYDLNIANMVGILVVATYNLLNEAARQQTEQMEGDDD